MTEGLGLTEYVADFIVRASLEDVPSDVLPLAKRSILDGLGLAVAGSRSVAAGVARQYATEHDCGDQSTVLGTPQRTSPRVAAFLNGIAIHADDFDDTQLAKMSTRVYGLLTHPTAPVLPSALAIAERDGRTGADLLGAYLIGVEVETKIAEAIDPRHYSEGFHSTGTLGTFGSAAAVAHLLSLPLQETRVCLGIAASQAAGLRENFGTMTKPFHAGRASESGLMAAELAQAGYSAAPNILEAERGFFKAAGGGYDPDLIFGRLGQPWTFLDPGISIKPHPSGSLTHPGMGAMLDLLKGNDIQPAQVERVFVWTNTHMPNALIHHRPTNQLEAKFSMEFCMAILLLERKAGLAEFTDEVVRRADVQRMIERIVFEAHPEAEASGYHKMTTLIRIDLTNGTSEETRADFGKGSPKNPMSDDDLVTKFTECAMWGGVAEQDALAAATRVKQLDDEPSIGQLLRLLKTDA